MKKVVEPSGKLKFLNLDEVDAFRDAVFEREYSKLSESDIKKLKEKKYANRGEVKASKPYTVAGLITEYIVRDGFKSGTKVAFVTLEDYTGSYTFRLNDRDYMRFKDQLGEQRFVIFRLNFSPSKEYDRLYVNVNEIVEMKEAFDKYAKKLSIVVPFNELTEEDVQFFSDNFNKNIGGQKLSFYIEDPVHQHFVELNSMQKSVEINEDTLRVIDQYKKFVVFLN